MDFPVIWAASSISVLSILTIIWNILLVLIGINLLIIVHEFGHFIVARMCGVRCDKFYIWFDLYGWHFLRFKWGDTEYGLGVLPLGGYVKMLGQEDNPGAIKAEIERAKFAQSQPAAEENAEGDIAEQNAAEKKITEKSSAPVLPQEELEKLEKSLYAPDSYLSKSVPQRMAIIVAGVVMNVIFAFLCGIGAYMFGMDALPSVVGGTVPGGSAWEAGLLPGDKVTAIDGKPVKLFIDINTAILGSSKETMEMQIERPGAESPITVTLTPKMQKHALVATVGIFSANTPKLLPENFYSPFAAKNPDIEKLKGNETLIAINGEKITSYEQIRTLENKYFDKPLTYTFLNLDEADGKPVDVTLQPVRWRTAGYRFKMGPTMSLRKEGGFQIGDVIQRVNGQTLDPLHLPGWIDQQAANGTDSFEVTVLRGHEEITLTVPVAQRTAESMYYTLTGENIAVPAFGISYTALPEVVFDEAASSKEENKGGVIKKVIFKGEVPEELRGKTSGKETKNGLEITNDDTMEPLPILVHDLLQCYPAGTEVTLETSGKPEVYESRITEAGDGYHSDRGFRFRSVTFKNKAESFREAVSMGGRDTTRYLLMVYHFLRNMTVGQATGTSRVSAKGMGGPLLIVTAAYDAAANGMGTLLILLCMLGANLAVINILPIPVLDGGHVVFLLYEAIFRKPPNENVQIILSYLGLFLILALMVWVFALDLGFIKRM
ncbi:MAG: site-2 protease family protein [Planctomycetaceae bacterium]|jgi:regulator of sigma E protease|nr:site-2 protease family protein [Planctomycetaceae bacterium]